MVAHLGQRGVAQSSHHRRLALELLAHCPLLFVVEGLFDRDRSVAQMDRLRLVDRAHSAARQQADDPITLLQERAVGQHNSAPTWVIGAGSIIGTAMWRDKAMGERL